MSARIPEGVQQREDGLIHLFGWCAIVRQRRFELRLQRFGDRRPDPPVPRARHLVDRVIEHVVRALAEGIPVIGIEK